MTSFRCLALLTFLCVSFSGLPYFGGTDQAHSATAQEKQEPESASSSQTDQPSTKPADESEQELIARLEKFLTGTNWTGNFVIEGKEKLISEHYEILSAKKSEFGDKWNLIARIKYGTRDFRCSCRDPSRQICRNLETRKNRRLHVWNHPKYVRR